MLSLALFPQVAPKFLSYRDGPRQEEQAAPAQPEQSAAPAAPQQSGVREFRVEYKF